MTDFFSSLEQAPDYLNVRELAALLRVSQTSIYRLVERRVIPFHRLPRGLRFDRRDVEAYLQGCRVESVAPAAYERQKTPH